MGRIEKSQGLAPPAVRKDLRAKQARQIINKTIPALLASNARARKGSESSELIVDPQVATTETGTGGDYDEAAYVKRKGQGRRKAKDDSMGEKGAKKKRKRAGRQGSIDTDLINLAITPAPTTTACRTVRIISTDTLTAARILATASRVTRKDPNICILNMASPLRPGGGVLSGATSQEEFLCARTTLLPSLLETYYRLPELGGIWSPNVLVFRNAAPLDATQGELGVADRFWVNVVSAGMLRFPELEGGDEEGRGRRLSKGDRAVVEAKMCAVLRIVALKGVRKLVLGAWGCGAYGNPVVDIAQAWRRVLDGGKKSKETWPNLDVVVFAIAHRKMAADFADAFDAGIEVETGPGDDVAEEGDEEDGVAEELRTKIAEMEGQLSKVWNSDLKARMGVIVEGLRAQLREREGGTPSVGPDEEGGEGGVMIGEHDSGEEEDDEEDEEEQEKSSEEEEYVKV